MLDNLIKYNAIWFFILKSIPNLKIWLSQKIHIFSGNSKQFLWYYF